MTVQPRNSKASDKTVNNELSRSIQEIASAYNLRLKKDPAAVPWKIPGTNRTMRETKADVRWLWVIPCRRGRKVAGVKANIFCQSSTELGFLGAGPKLRSELLRIAGVRPLQSGDQEFSVAFPDKLLPVVALVVKPYARRAAVILS